MQLIVCAAVVLSCFIVYFFVYLLIYYSLYISSLCVFECICLFITTLISSYFSAWPRHSVRLALAIFAWLCSLFFFLLMSWHFLYQEHNKDCCCCCYYVKITFFLFKHLWSKNCNKHQYHNHHQQHLSRAFLFCTEAMLQQLDLPLLPCISGRQTW